MSNLIEDLLFAWETTTTPVKADLVIHPFKVVHKEDHEPVSIINPNMEKGPWIAGGAVLRWYQNQPVGESDIDVFCANAKQAADVIKAVKDQGHYHVKYESENAVTLSHWSKTNPGNPWTIQVITRRHFVSMDDVLNNFDITVCQVGTAGNEYVLGKTTAKDIREKNLRFNRPLQPDALKRLVKYWTYGYRPVEGLLEAIQNNPDAVWKFELDGDYQNAF